MDAVELKRLQEEFIRTKERMIAAENWPPNVKWKETIRQWIGAIVITTKTIPEDLVYKNHKFALTIQFPTADSGDIAAEENFQIKIAAMAAPRAPVRVNLFGQETISQVSIEQFVNYRERIQLGEVPINLHGDVIFELVKVLGYCLDGYRYYSESDREVKYSNLLCVEKQHLFPGRFEYLTLSEQKQLSTNNNWVYCKLDHVTVGGNFLRDGYCRTALVDELCKYQMDYFIRHFFSLNNRNDSKPLLATAREFAANLSFLQLGESYKVLFCRSHTYVRLISASGKTLKDKLNFSIDKKMIDQKTTVSCSDAWSSAIKEEILSQAVKELTVEDVDWILHAFVEVYSTGQELKKLLVESDFPSLADHFESFDPQFLRGKLAETDVSRKIMVNHRNILTLRQEAMESTSSVPIAVVDLMGSYLPL